MDSDSTSSVHRMLNSLELHVETCAESCGWEEVHYRAYVPIIMYYIILHYIIVVGVCSCKTGLHIWVRGQWQDC